jgi:hypothetical protein
MEEVVRDLLSKLEGATDDARIALVKHGLPSILDSLSPGKRGELPEKAQAALAEEFVAQGPGMQLQTALANLTGLKEQVMSRSIDACPIFYASFIILFMHVSSSCVDKRTMLSITLSALGCRRVPTCGNVVNSLTVKRKLTIRCAPHMVTAGCAH